MKIFKSIRSSAILAVLTVTILLSCNKELEQIQGPATPEPGSGITLGATIAATPTDSLYYALIKRAGLLETINNSTPSFTMFVPSDNAMKLFINAISGGLVPIPAPNSVFIGFINANIPVATANAIVSYNILPQKLLTANISSAFPNMQYPTLFNPAPTLSALLRLDAFPSTRNGAWENNVPLTAVDIIASNGVIHNTAILVTPPSRSLWDRINTDANLTYLKAAVQRADSGVVPNPANPNTLELALSSIGANLTVFAPTDAAFRTLLTGAIYQALLPLVVQQLTAAYISAGMTPANAAALAAVNAPPIALNQATTLASTPGVFSIPALYPYLTAQNVKGIIAYHILPKRAFTNNFYTTPTFVHTLLNTVVATHPGVSIAATFGTPLVTAASAQGVGNTTASNIIINASPFRPDPNGTSDQMFTNGVLHEIDQVLLPQ